MRDRDTPWVTLQQACEVAGVKYSTARYWFNQGYLPWDERDHRAHKAGAVARVSERTVLALTIATRLVSMGMLAHRAVHAARAFTTTGSDFGEPSRDPGELYPDPKTFTALAVYPTGSTTIFPVSEEDAVPLINVFFPRWGDGMHERSGYHEGAVLLLLDLIFRHVETSLDAQEGAPLAAKAHG